MELNPDAGGRPARSALLDRIDNWLRYWGAPRFRYKNMQDAATLLAECRAVLEVAAPVLSEPPPTITSGTAQSVSLQADLSLPAVLGTLPRYRLFQFVTDCWECPDGEWVKFEDVARIVSALQPLRQVAADLLAWLDNENFDADDDPGCVNIPEERLAPLRALLKDHPK